MNKANEAGLIHRVNVTAGNLMYLGHPRTASFAPFALNLKDSIVQGILEPCFEFNIGFNIEVTMRKHIWVLILIWSVILGSCQQQTGQDVSPIQNLDEKTPVVEVETNLSPAATPTRTPYAFGTSEPGTVTIHGELLAMDPDNLPDPDDAIFLVPLPDSQVTMIPHFEADEVPQAEVNEVTGEFVFTDIEPGLYAIVVLTISNAQIPARTEDSSFVILRVEEKNRDETIELGYIRIP